MKLWNGPVMQDKKKPAVRCLGYQFTLALIARAANGRGLFILCRKRTVSGWFLESPPVFLRFYFRRSYQNSYRLV